MRVPLTPVGASLVESLAIEVRRSHDHLGGTAAFVVLENRVAPHTAGRLRRRLCARRRECAVENGIAKLLCSR